MMHERATDPSERSGGDIPKAVRPRHRVRRWTLRIFLLAVGLIVAIVICLQILLWTDIPRTFVLQKLQNTLGLRVEAATIDFGWSGHTTLQNVKISLPLAQQAFLEVPNMEVTHTSLAMIMLTQNVELKEADFHQPTVLILQNASGRWNVAEAVDLITRAGGKKQAQDNSTDAIQALPVIAVDHATVKLIDRDGRTSTIEPLNITGHPDGSLVWKYDAQVPDRLKLTGQVSPGGVWEHEVAFEIGDLSPWLTPWMKQVPRFRASGTWHGRADGASIAGRVNFDELTVATYSARVGDCPATADG